MSHHAILDISDPLFPPPRYYPNCYRAKHLTEWRVLHMCRPWKPQLAEGNSPGAPDQVRSRLAYVAACFGLQWQPDRVCGSYARDTKERDTVNCPRFLTARVLQYANCITRNQAAFDVAFLDSATCYMISDLWAVPLMDSTSDRPLAIDDFVHRLPHPITL